MFGALPKTGRISLATARKALKLLPPGRKACGITAQSLREGMEVEREHRDVTRGGMKKTALIAAAHICESSGYYTELKKMERKLRKKPGTDMKAPRQNLAGGSRIRKMSVAQRKAIQDAYDTTSDRIFAEREGIKKAFRETECTHRDATPRCKAIYRKYKSDMARNTAKYDALKLLDAKVRKLRLFR